MKRRVVKPYGLSETLLRPPLCPQTRLTVRRGETLVSILRAAGERAPGGNTHTHTRTSGPPICVSRRQKKNKTQASCCLQKGAMYAPQSEHNGL